MPTLFHNGKIYVSFSPLVVAGWLLVDSGRVAHYGGGEPPALPGAERVDLEGRVVMPGFVDAHVHLDELGELLNSLDLRAAGSIAELKERLRGHSPRENWVLGFGWDQERFAEKRWPRASDIDEVVADRPVLLTRVDGHSGLLNSVGLAQSGVLGEADLQKYVERDLEGNPTGIVKEDALDHVRAKIRQKRGEQTWRKYLGDAARFAASCGVTSVGFVSCSEQVYRVLEAMPKEELGIRVFVYVTPEFLEKPGFRAHLGGDHRLRIVGLKLFSDGSLGSRTAHLSFPYHDDPGNTGVALMSEEELYRYAKMAEDLGLHVATHAIGDRALDTVLRVYSGLRPGHRIEHASLIRRDQYARIREVGATLVTQPHFVVTDFWVLDRVGEENAHMVYPFKTILRERIAQAFSTDAPVEPINPWETVEAAVERGGPENRLGGLTPHEKLDVAEALDLYTRGSARALRNTEIGTLERGCHADLIVLDRDPLTSRPASVRVLETYVGGRPVYRATQAE